MTVATFQEFVVRVVLSGAADRLHKDYGADIVEHYKQISGIKHLRKATTPFCPEGSLLPCSLPVSPHSGILRHPSVCVWYVRPDSAHHPDRQQPRPRADEGVRCYGGHLSCWCSHCGTPDAPNVGCVFVALYRLSKHTTIKSFDLKWLRYDAVVVRHAVNQLHVATCG